MPPKAAGGEDVDYPKENEYMTAKIAVLQARLMMKAEQTANSRKAEVEMRDRIVELDEMFVSEEKRRKENTDEMSRQYKEMQDSFNERIKLLQEQVADAKQEIEAVTREIERVRVEKDEIIRQKDQEIKSLSHKMETMAFEFADMLKETLDKMSQRIEVTHNSWDRDSSKPPLLNRLQAFQLTNGLPAPEK
jgi:DNA repair exonuclease SbcCD ATPase subunit